MIESPIDVPSAMPSVLAAPSSDLREARGERRVEARLLDRIEIREHAVCGGRDGGHGRSTGSGGLGCVEGR